jgi:hypothetical protein
VALGRIETGRTPGAGNWCLAELESVDWDDCPEEDEFPASAILDGESDGDPAEEPTAARDWDRGAAAARRDR